MSALVERLYPMPDLRRTPLSTLRWWESRRLFYNAVVGSTGLVTLAGFMLFAGPPESPWQPLLAAGLYGAAANFFYTAGWGIEMVARLVWGRKAPAMGPLLFRQGLIFSVGLTLFPLMIATVFTLARGIAWVLGIHLG
jgi:hypothetical protein